MPSKSRKLFRDKLLPDVVSLIDAHRRLNPTGRGRRALGYLTGSATVTLCASWEVYIEEVVCEVVSYISNETDDPHALPDRVKGKIIQGAVNQKHEFSALQLSGAGWKEVYKREAGKQCGLLNTPKFGNIATLLNDWLGLKPSELEDSWRHDKDRLNALVRTRGELAHRGSDAAYVRMSDLRTAKEMVDDLVVDTDRLLSEHVRGIVGKRPWRNT